MITAYTAYTNEVDDATVAVAEIEEQLAAKGGLKANSVGIVSAYAEFVESGVWQALAAAMPFEILGTTTMASAVEGSEGGTFALTLTVLTSDDVKFATGLSDAITEEDDAAMQAGYDAARAKLGEKPALILSFVPLLPNVGGDFFVETLDRISGGVPNFGALAVDHNEDYHDSAVLYNGDAYANRHAQILLAGAVAPKFYIASISAEKVFKEKGVVTASQGNQLQTVNNMPVGDYLAGLGLKRDPNGSIVGINSFPFVMDLNDGTTPIVRVMFAITPEGYAVCGGNIPVGSVLTVGSINATEVLTTTEAKLKEALAGDKDAFMLAYSCIGRYFSLGYEPTSEMDLVQKMLKGTGVPYQFIYAGGEICPVYPTDGGGTTANRSHNDTCVICVL